MRRYMRAYPIARMERHSAKRLRILRQHRGHFPQFSACLFRVERLARDVSDFFKSEPIVALCVLKGGYRYLDLVELDQCFIFLHKLDFFSLFFFVLQVFC